MNGLKKKMKKMAERAFDALSGNPEWAARFERDFGMKPSEMRQGYTAGDEKFCSALKRRGQELVDANPAQAARLREAFSGAGAPVNNKTKLQNERT